MRQNVVDAASRKGDFVSEYQRVGGSAFRELMSRFPTGVAVVTSVDEEGEPRGLTCSSLASVTLCPPTLLVCIRDTSPTLAAIHARKAFAVNLLNEHSAKVAKLFSTPIPDRFHQIDWHASDVLGLPWLETGTVAHADCLLSRGIPMGDHVVVLGEVVAVERFTSRPLINSMRNFAGWRDSLVESHALVESHTENGEHRTT